MSNEITPRDALTRLGASTAEAIAQVLDMFAPGAVQRGEVSVPEGSNPFSNLPFPAVAISVSYVDGVTGANIFVMTPEGARALATAMGVPPPEADAENAGSIELTELELSAVAEAANQMMAAAASAIGVVIGQEIEISPPERRVLNDAKSALEAYGRSPHATSTTFLISGEQCRLLQLVPSAFVQRMVRAIDEARIEHTGASARASLAGAHGAQGFEDDEAARSVALQEALGDISLRVWAELGRARLPLGKALALPLGAVVDLDRAADAPIDLFVNGVRFAEGHLLVTEDHAARW